MRKILLVGFILVATLAKVSAQRYYVVNSNASDNPVGVVASTPATYPAITFPGAVTTIYTGNLRSCIADANSQAAGSFIYFAPNAGSFTGNTISPTSALPAITVANLTIDATNNTAYTGTPIVILKGLTTVNAGTVGGTQFDGLAINSNSGQTIKGLIFQNFVNGINVGNGGVNNVTVQGCWFGVDATGATNGGYAGTGYGIAQAGILLSGGTGHTIGGTVTQPGASPGNVLSGCCMQSSGSSGAFYGAVYMNGASSVTIQGNIIGLNAAGTSGANVGNGELEPLHQHGILITSNGNSSNIVDNVISNNLGTGIYVTASPSNIIITGNMIGTDITGTTPIGNRGGGISFINGGSGIKIGGNSATLRNIISGNGGAPDSRNCRANQYNGSLAGCASGPCAASCPTDYDGTLQCGIYLNAVNGCQIAGNYIGTDATGKTASIPTTMPTGTPIGNLNGLGNLYAGIKIEGSSGSSSPNTIGGPSPAYRNIIGNNGFDPFVTSGNASPYLGHGIQLNGASVTGTIVQYNFVGIGADGKTPIGNRQDGISLEGASNSKILNNVSSDNAYGIFLQTDFSNGNSSGQANNNVITSNLIGTDSTGQIAVGNGVRPTYDAGGDGGGIGVQMGATGNVIGNATGGNVIAGNLQGIVFRLGSAGFGGSPHGNTVAYNYIGLGSDGTTSIPNRNFGVVLSSGAATNTIGGSAAAANYIANNGQTGYGAGIWVDSASNNTISYNYVGQNKSGAAAGNINDGIQVTNHSTGNSISNNTIVNTLSNSAPGAGNGIAITSGASTTSITNNTIQSNAGDGINISGSSIDNIIGGTSTQGNTITANTGNGVQITDAGSNNNAINSNSIFCNGSGTTGRGIELKSAGNNNYAKPTITGSPTSFTVTGPAGSWIEIYLADTTCHNCKTNTTSNQLEGKTLVASGTSPLPFTPPAGLTNNDYTATVSASSPSSSPAYHNTSEFTTCQTLCTMTAAIAPTSATICSGSSTTLSATPSNGTSPYTYAWTPSTGLSSTTVSNPTANPTATTTYSVTITDKNNCTATKTAVVTVNSDPTAVAGGNVSICNGSSTTLSVTPSGGTGTYTYSWSPSTGLSSSTVQNPTANPTSTTTYTVTVKDANNCTNTVAAKTTVTVNSDPTAVAGGNVSICNGSSTTLSVTPSGGTGTYTYSWSPSTGLSSSTVQNPTANPTSTTTYTVTVKDANNCTNTVAAKTTVTVNSDPTAVAGGNVSICNGGSTTLSVTPSGGSGTYTYSWSPSTGLSSSTVQNPTANPTSTTTYTVTVKDANNCTNTVAAKTTVTVNSDPTAVAGGNVSICNGSSTTLSVTPSGGSGTYTYSWSPSTGLSSSTVQNPTANPTSTTTYTVTVKDANNCANTVAAKTTVTVNSDPTALTSGNVSICNGGSTTLSVTPSGGSGTYTYSWSPSTGLSSSTVQNPTANPTSTTTYTVTVKDANNCTNTSPATAVVTVNTLPAFQAISGTTPVCAGTQGVVYSVTNTSGYTYNWTVPASVGTIASGNGTNSITVNVVSAIGSGTIKVTETNTTTGCSSLKPDSLPVAVQNGIAFQPVVGKSPVCASSTNVTYSINPTAGNTYTWTVPASIGTITGGAGTNSITVNIVNTSSIVTGTIKVTEKNASGCTSLTPDSLKVTVDPLPTETIATKGDSICGGPGAVNLSASGATGGDTYHWYTASTGGSSINTGATYSPTISSTTTYYVTAVTSVGCESANRTSVTGKVNPLPTETIATNGDSICGGPGAVNLSASGATGSETYHWYTASTGGSSINTGASYNPTISSTTTYYVAIVTTSGCESASRASVTGKVNPLPTEAIATNGDSICGGPGAVNLSASGATGSETYHWYTASTGGSSINTGASYSPTISSTTTYYVAIVTTSGCESASRASVTGKVNPLPTEAIATNGDSICGGPGAVNLSASGATGSETYHWYTASTGGSSINTGASYSPTISSTTTYYVAIVTTSGCESVGRTSVTGTVNPLPLPDAISGNDKKICLPDANSPHTYSVASKTGYKYHWILPAGVTIITATTDSSSIGVGFSTGITGTDTLKLVETTPSGCSNASLPDTFTVAVNNDPQRGTIYSSANALCMPSSDSYTYTVRPWNSNYTYQWNIPANAAVMSSTDSSRTIQFTGNVTNRVIDTLSVVETNTLTTCSNAASPDTFTVRLNPSPQFQAVMGSDTVCAKTPNKVYYISGNGKTGYTYAWTTPSGITVVSGGSATDTSITVNFTAASGIETIKVKEMNNYSCPSQVQDSLAIDVKPSPNPVINVPSVLCNTIPVQLSASPGGGQYSYSWNFGDSSVAVAQDTSNQQNPSHQFNFTGNARTTSKAYNVKLIVTDVTVGCKDSTTSPLTVYRSPGAKAVANSDLVNNDSLGICAGNNNLSLQDSVWGGVDSTKFTYHWTSNPGKLVVDSLSQDPATFTANVDATYYSTVTDPASGCTVIDSLVVFIKSPVVIADTAALNGKVTLCGLNQSLAFSPVVKGGTNNYVKTWTLAGGNVSDYLDTTKADPVFTDSTYGTFKFYFTVQDKGANCTVEDSVQVNVNRVPSISLNRSNDTVCSGTPISLTATVHLLDKRYPAMPYLYVWSKVVNITGIDTTYSNPIDTLTKHDSVYTYQFKPDAGKNFYAVQIIDSNGCVSNHALDTIFSEPKQNLYFPNVITPNADNLNDDFRIAEGHGHGEPIFPGATLEVYNRWGDKVFAAKNYPYGDGKWWNAHGINDGVYYYYLKTGCGQNEYKGWVEIINNTDQAKQ